MITCAIFKTVVTSDINLGNDVNYYMDKLYFEKKKIRNRHQRAKSSKCYCQQNL